MSAPEPSLRPKRGYCGSCGGAYFTLGMRSRWVPHAPDCPRLAKLRRERPQSIAEQDREREALADPHDSPWSDQHGQPRTYFKARSPWEQDIDIEGGAA